MKKNKEVATPRKSPPKIPNATTHTTATNVPATTPNALQKDKNNVLFTRNCNISILLLRFLERNDYHV